MTPAEHVTTPHTDLSFVRHATDNLLAAAADLDESSVAAPSLLPGWTRGHVLAHLARNADGMVEVLAGRPMYPSNEARNAAIERDAPRPLAVHLADLRESAARLDAAFTALPAAGWDRTLTLRFGEVTARHLPYHRWNEIELHRIDLGTGYGIDDLPAAFLERSLTALAERFAGHPAITAAIELRTEDGTVRHIGAAPADAAEKTVVVGPAAALVGWLTGRSTGSGLSASSPLPALPPL